MHSLQLVPLDKSPLAGAGMNIPARPFELDPDWEIDPSALEIGGKIGERRSNTCRSGLGEAVAFSGNKNLPLSHSTNSSI